MSVPLVALLLGSFALLFALAAWQWVRVVVGAFRWAASVFFPPASCAACEDSGWLRAVGDPEGDRVDAWYPCRFCASGHGAPSPDNRPKAGPGSGSHPEGAQRPPTQEGVDGRGGVGYPARHYLLDLGSFVAFGAALAPDFESFFGGFATAVAAGGVLLIAVVVVMAVRRLTSF